ncbi:MAG TPA: type II CAAX endopeptidase family protein [Polyangiaceae bacterium]|nr:type II CAAX endopeptidase family protein [Polyangiaceae bacterium]
MNTSAATTGRAPWWHTTLLVSLIVLVATTGLLLTSNTAAPTLTGGQGARLSTLYLPLVLVQWGLVLYVCRIGRNRDELPALLGAGWNDARRAAGDVALAAMVFVVIFAVNATYTHLRALGPNASTTSLLPATTVERVAWVAVACSVGFCEEVVYRGYLLSELSARTRFVTLGVILQALLFGLAHADQGLVGAIPVALDGVLLGVLAHSRKSLVPGIICHVAVDLVSGLIS